MSKLIFTYFVLIAVAIFGKTMLISGTAAILTLILMAIDFYVTDKYFTRKEKEIEDKVKPKQI